MENTWKTDGKLFKTVACNKKQENVAKAISFLL